MSADCTSKIQNIINCTSNPMLGILNPFPNKPWFLRACRKSLLKTLWEKEEIARNEQFLLFPQCFLPVWRTFSHYHQI